MAVQFNWLIFQITLICAQRNLMLPKNSSLMIHSVIRLHDSRFFSKNWFSVARLQSHSLFSASLKAFCLTARTYLNF